MIIIIIMLAIVAFGPSLLYFLFTMKMKMCGRWLPWESVCKSLEEGEGCLIINQSHLPGTWWWVDHYPLSEKEHPVDLIQSSAILVSPPYRLRSECALKKALPKANILHQYGFFNNRKKPF